MDILTSVDRAGLGRRLGRLRGRPGRPRTCNDRFYFFENRFSFLKTRVYLFENPGSYYLRSRRVIRVTGFGF